MGCTQIRKYVERKDDEDNDSLPWVIATASGFTEKTEKKVEINSVWRSVDQILKICLMQKSITLMEHLIKIDNKKRLLESITG